MRKKLLPIILVCCMLAALFAVGVTAADDIVASGNCGANGSNVQWTLSSSGNLTISGRGAMGDFTPILSLDGSGGLFTHKIPWFDNKNMITSLTVNDGVTAISAYAFYGLNRLTKVTFTDGVSSIEDGAFYGCSNLLSFTISDNVTSIGKFAFGNCDRLTKMLIPRNVINIGESAFRGCDVLQSVTILADTPIINASTFEGCSALKELTIPNNVIIIKNNAFYGCDKLQTVYCIGVENSSKEFDVVEDGNDSLFNVATYVFENSIDTYRINALSISDTDGNLLTAIPKTSFFATVSVTNRSSKATPTIILASYTESGQYQGLMYVTVEESVGATAKITLPVDNSDGKIAQLKAFAVKSFSSLEVIGNLVSFP